MDIEELVHLARFTSRDQFAEKMRNLFFVTPVADDSAIEFETVVLDRSTPAAGVRRSISSRVIPLVKAPGNPYPDRVSVGRARNCDVVLRDPSVSKLHAHLREDPDGKRYLVDLRSHNGTRVNGKPLAPGEARQVSVGDLVVFGGVSGRLLGAAEVHQLLLEEEP